MTTGTIIFLVLLLLGVVTAWKGIKTVPQGWVWTVERFGAFTRLLQPGLNLIIPNVGTVGRKMNVQEVVLDIPEPSVITRVCGGEKVCHWSGGAMSLRAA